MQRRWEGPCLPETRTIGSNGKAPRNRSSTAGYECRSYAIGASYRGRSLSRDRCLEINDRDVALFGLHFLESKGTIGN
jgi:hypothetical protein